MDSINNKISFIKPIWKSFYFLKFFFWALKLNVQFFVSLASLFLFLSFFSRSKLEALSFFSLSSFIKIKEPNKISNESIKQIKTKIKKKGKQSPPSSSLLFFVLTNERFFLFSFVFVFVFERPRFRKGRAKSRLRIFPSSSCE